MTGRFPPPLARCPLRVATAAMLLVFASGIVGSVWVPSGHATAHAGPNPPRRLRVDVVATYPHDATAFTQGLVLHQKALYESTGWYGRSVLREVDVQTGKTRREVRLPPQFFGEGLAAAGNQLLQLTWREGVALAYDATNLARIATFSYSGEGWGLCFDGSRFVMSDGSDRLSFRDAATFRVTGEIAARLQGQPVANLNELECVGASVYANVWQTDTIVEVSRADGVVRAVIDASGLLSPPERAALNPAAVLNGIAYDADTSTFLITGKLWPKLFRVRFVAR